MCICDAEEYGLPSMSVKTTPKFENRPLEFHEGWSEDSKFLNYACAVSNDAPYPWPALYGYSIILAANSETEMANSQKTCMLWIMFGQAKYS